MQYPNPFEDDDENAVPAACGALRYRRFVLPGDEKQEGPGSRTLNLVVRAEVDATLPNADGEQQYVSVKCLNEYEPTTTMNWRKHLESQRGAVLASELKNNAFKLARWTAQAIVADCSVIKLGYVSRKDPKDPWSHSLLMTQTYRPDEFA